MRTKPYKMRVGAWKQVPNGRAELRTRILDDNGNPTGITGYYLGTWPQRNCNEAMVAELQFGEERFNILEHIDQIDVMNTWIGERLKTAA